MPDLKKLPGFTASDCAKILAGVMAEPDIDPADFSNDVCLDCNSDPCVCPDLPDFPDPRDSPENTRGGL